MAERTLLVFGDKEFRITIPEEAKLTFAPFSPPSKDRGYGGGGYDNAKAGTLRIYLGTKDNCIGVFAGVRGYRDMSQVKYQEKVAEQVVESVWRDDAGGYERQEQGHVQHHWVNPDEEPKALPRPKKKNTKTARSISSNGRRKKK